MKEHSIKVTNTRRYLSMFGKTDFFGLVVIIILPLLSCEESVNRGFDTNNTLYISAIDSLTAQPLYNVRVVELESYYTFDQVIQGESFRSGYSVRYYQNEGYTDSGYKQLKFVYAATGIPGPNYFRFAACKEGYNIWKWMSLRDTIYHLDKWTDSLCIRMVKEK
jgi:hypothetical protein